VEQGEVVCLNYRAEHLSGNIRGDGNGDYYNILGFLCTNFAIMVFLAKICHLRTNFDVFRASK
jgi:hypothetical protein